MLSRVAARHSSWLANKSQSNGCAPESNFFIFMHLSPHARRGRTLWHDCHWIIANCSTGRLHIIIKTSGNIIVCWEQTNPRIKGWADVSFAATETACGEIFQLPPRCQRYAGCFCIPAENHATTQTGRNDLWLCNAPARPAVCNYRLAYRTRESQKRLIVA